MPRKPIEYRCLLISPSDVKTERNALTKTVGDWNAHVGEALGARVNLVRWESHSVPDSSAPPQESLNRQIVDNCDFGIGVFWARLGTKTATDDSGSAEEIRRLTERGATVLLYFLRPVPQNALKDDQYSRLQAFKREMERRALAGSFSSVRNLCNQVQLHLTTAVAGLLPKDRGIPGTPAQVLTAPTPDVRVHVNTSLVMPQDELIPVLQAQAQNHSPVVVYLRNLSLLMDDGYRVFVPRDVVTGARLMRTELKPGESFGFFYSPKDIRDMLSKGKILCAIATDDIGREYRSDEDEMKQVLRQLLQQSDR